MNLISFTFILSIHLVSCQIDILQNRTVNTKGETLQGTDSYPLINSDSFWLIDLNNPDIRFELATESSTFNFLVTSIIIQTFDGFSDKCVIENIPSQQDYLVSYEIGGQKRLINLNSQVGEVNGNTLFVKINSIPADRITISKTVSTLGTYCMRYGLMGHEVARVSVLSYGLSLPNLQRDDEYTGLCSAKFCFGGKGRLTDGITDTDNVEKSGVGWACLSDRDLPCVYNFRISLTTTTMINRIELLGFRGGSLDYPVVGLSGREVDYGLEIEGSTFIVTVPIVTEVDSLNLSLVVQNGRSLILTEVAVFSGENVNIAVENESFLFDGIVSAGDVPTSASIANFQEERFVQQTVPSNLSTTTTTTMTTQRTTRTASQTRVTNAQTNTVQDTQQTTQNETQITTSPPVASMEQCMSKTIFASSLGVLGIFTITILLNSIIVVAILGRNNRRIRRKLHALEATQTESFKLYDFDTHPKNPPSNQFLRTHGTVIENMITTDDVYDSLDVVTATRDSGIESPNNVTLQRNSINPNLFQQSSLPMIHNFLPNQPKDGPHYECSVVDENEVQMEDNVAFRDTGVPQICVEKCESYKQSNLGVPMTENIGYMSSRTAQQLSTAPIQQDDLGVPMTENIGYMSSRNGLSVPESQSGEPKHIYASITNEYCIPLPDRNSEMTGYNVLKHK